MTMWNVGDKAVAKETVAPYGCATIGLEKGAIYTIYEIRKEEPFSFGGITIVTIGFGERPLGLYFDIGHKCIHGNADLWHESCFEKFVEFKSMDKLREGLKAPQTTQPPALPVTPARVPEDA